ncbi:unnamed protein product [Withania somnifera]
MTNVVNNTPNVSSSPKPPPSLNTTTSLTTTTRGGGNGLQACAACKYQRRRCVIDCPLAPYFPAERQKDFLNAHKLFGVSNLLKVLKNVASFQKENAMKSLIFEANIRAKDPVGGCYRVIWNLYRQINLYQEELQFVYREIVRIHAAAIQEQRNIDTKDCSVSGINNSTLNFDVLPFYGIYGFDRCKSNFQIVKGKRLEGFNSDEEFESQAVMSCSNDKQSFEHGVFKPYLGTIHDYKGKGIETELRYVN